jgi:hypothetical protein
MESRLQKADWEVRDVDRWFADDMVRRFHYAAGAANTGTYLHGLFPRGSFWNADCAGIAWWIPPTKAAAKALAGEAWGGVLALSRLVIVPGTPGNAASFLVGRSTTGVTTV